MIRKADTCHPDKVMGLPRVTLGMLAIAWSQAELDGVSGQASGFKSQREELEESR